MTHFPTIENFVQAKREQIREYKKSMSGVGQCPK
jgi:hypothetical protein